MQMLDILFFALISAATSLFFEFCLRPDNVAGKLGDVLEGLKIGKPLGLCPPCNNFWVSIVISVFVLPLPLLPVVVVLGNLITRILMRIIE